MFASMNSGLSCRWIVPANIARLGSDQQFGSLQQSDALQSWLHTNGLDFPYVTNASAAYSVHGYARDVVISLHYARHWATISVVYHKSADARDSFERTSQALNLIDALGAEGGRCYIQAYFP